MAEFTVNPQRTDPYEGSKFRVKWDGQYIPAISRVSPLVRVTQIITHTDGSEPGQIRLQPGENAFQPITLERGLTEDRAFENWANLVWNIAAGAGREVALNEMRKDILVELYNEAGQLAMSWQVYRCWPSEYQALSELQSGSPGDAVERLVLQTEGWLRDPAVTEPKQP